MANECRDAFEAWWAVNGLSDWDGYGSRPEYDASRVRDFAEDAWYAARKYEPWNYDMEAAPKDGTFILITTVGSDETCLTSWVEPLGWVDIRTSMHDLIYYESAIAWQPLPEPAEVRE